MLSEVAQMLKQVFFCIVPNTKWLGADESWAGSFPVTSRLFIRAHRVRDSSYVTAMASGDLASRCVLECVVLDFSDEERMRRSEGAESSVRIKILINKKMHKSGLGKKTTVYLHFKLTLIEKQVKKVENQPDHLSLKCIFGK